MQPYHHHAPFKSEICHFCAKCLFVKTIEIRGCLMTFWRSVGSWDMFETSTIADENLSDWQKCSWAKSCTSVFFILRWVTFADFLPIIKHCCVNTVAQTSLIPGLDYLTGPRSERLTAFLLLWKTLLKCSRFLFNIFDSLFGLDYA